METLGKRISRIRKEAYLSMEAFGEKIGITKTSVSRIERDINGPAEQTIRVICSEFGVNYDWLKHGLGPIYSNLPETLMDELQDEYNLSELDRRIVEEFIKLPENERQVFRNYLHRVFLADSADNEKEAEGD